MVADLYSTVKNEIDVLIKEAKEATADKVITLSEVWTLSSHVIASFVKIADTLNADGADKKAVVLKAAELLYDEVIAPIDIPKIPNVIEPTFDKFAKSLFLELVSGLIDFVVKFTKKD